jgi:hypothetical protein
MREQSDAETPEKLARRTEFQNRRIGIASIEASGVTGGLVVETAVKNPDIAVGSDMHPDDLAPSMSIRALHARWKRRPVWHEPIRIWERRGFGVRRIPATLGVRRYAKGGNQKGRNKDGADRERSTPANCRWHVWISIGNQFHVEWELRMLSQAGAARRVDQRAARVQYRDATSESEWS